MKKGLLVLLVSVLSILLAQNFLYLSKRTSIIMEQHSITTYEVMTEDTYYENDINNI